MAGWLGCTNFLPMPLPPPRPAGPPPQPTADREAYARLVTELQERYTKEVAPAMDAIQDCKAAVEAAGGRWPDAVLLPGPGALDAAAREELMAHMRVSGRQPSPASGNGFSSGCCAADTHAPLGLPVHRAYGRTVHAAFVHDGASRTLSRVPHTTSKHGRTRVGSPPPAAEPVAGLEGRAALGVAQGRCPRAAAAGGVLHQAVGAAWARVPHAGGALGDRQLVHEGERAGQQVGRSCRAPAAMAGRIAVCLLPCLGLAAEGARVHVTARDRALNRPHYLTRHKCRARTLARATMQPTSSTSQWTTTTSARAASSSCRCVCVCVWGGDGAGVCAHGYVWLIQVDPRETYRQRGALAFHCHTRPPACRAGPVDIS